MKKSISTITLKSLVIGLLFSVGSVTSCRQDSQQEIYPEMNKYEGDDDSRARVGCQAQLVGTGGIGLGTVPALRPIASGTANSFDTDCDYFVAFPRNNYTRIVVATLNDPQVATAIRNLIANGPGIVPCTGGFGGGLARRRRSPTQADGLDDRDFIVLGSCRSNNALLPLAIARGTSVRSLLAIHLRLGNP